MDPGDDLLFFNLCDYCGEVFESPFDVSIHKEICGLHFSEPLRLSDFHDTPINVNYQTFEIVQEIRSTVKKFNLNKKSIRFNVKNPSSPDIDHISWLKMAIHDVTEYLMKNCSPNDKIGFTFTTSSLNSSNSCWIPYTTANTISGGSVWNMINSVFQSNASADLTDNFTISSSIVEMPRGAGRFNMKNVSYETFCRKKRGIITIANNDSLCLPRALVVGRVLAKTGGKRDPKYLKIRKDYSRMQERKAKELMRKSGVEIGEEGSGIPELQKFQCYMKNYDITVYEFKNNKRHKMFQGGNSDAKLKIYLIHENNHFNVVSSLTALFNCNYYCEKCNVIYFHKTQHICKEICQFCLRKTPCKKDDSQRYCSACSRQFPNASCFDIHLASSSKGKSICQSLKRCNLCWKTYNLDVRKAAHECDETFCTVCKAFKRNPHWCYVRKDKRSPGSRSLFVYFDIETRQEKKLIDDSLLHEPNLCVAQQSCSDCENENDMKRFCPSCGIREHIFEHNPLESFISYLLLPRVGFTKIICIAHNAQGFDSQFILKTLVDSHNIIPEIIMRGSKILSLKFKNITMIDSLNYFPMSLAKLPVAFDLPDDFKKGYFPHLFNMMENYEYIGELPDATFYSPDTMSVKERDKFFKWYHEQKKDNQYIFDFKKELTEYCINDVDILRRSCSIFRQYFIENCKVDPFAEAITIASACNLVFRRNFLKPETIGIIPRNGYRLTDRQSKTAIKWLLWEEHSRHIDIQHAGKGKEVVIPMTKLKVDGYDQRNNTIFEFSGCFFHGHPACYPNRRDDKIYRTADETMNTRYNDTMERIDFLKCNGYAVVHMWECEFREMLKTNAECAEYFKNNSFFSQEPLQPRDSFYGGRTGNTRMYYKALPDEEIHYVDVCSLYPYVCKYGKFPIGHPTLIVGDEECRRITGPQYNLNGIEGFVKCTVCPPNDLYHPVLPINKKGKLMFILCNACADELSSTPCNHSDKQRCLSGTWVVDELREAVKFGYKITVIYEIWSYQTIQYSKEQNIEGLFSQFINKFLKIKQEASGYNASANDNVSIDEYIESYSRVEGILLEKSKIKVNQGLRSLAKLMLNSFWGKFGQRENFTQTTITEDPSQLYEMLSNPNIAVNYIQDINEDMIVINWEYIEEAIEPSPNVNVAIAAYTTTQARLILYNYLAKLGERVLYYDTDSIIYIKRPLTQCYNPPLGNYLGDLTDELAEYGAGSYITEFVSGGPKNYAYCVKSTKHGEICTVCKVKGINLNFKNSQQINFDTIKRMIIAEEEEEEENIILENTHIRTKRDHSVVTVNERKSYKINFMKRVRTDDYDSLPYGHSKIRRFDTKC